MIRRLLFAVLWLAVAVFAFQIVYFVFFRVKAPRFNEGQPLNAVPVAVKIHGISAFCNDGTDGVWIGTERTGLYRYDLANKEAQPIVVPPVLKSATIRSLAVDQQNRLWAGTSDFGLFVRNGEEWKHYDLARRISKIRIAPDGTVFLATEKGLIAYQPKTDEWSEIRPADQQGIRQVSDLTFDPKGNLIIGTSCYGIILWTRQENGTYSEPKSITAKRRFGPGSAPNTASVPLDPCGEGLPSNQINSLCFGADGTLWAGTAAGLAWSGDSGQTWHFLRGRDYGDKMRGLVAGTPYKWEEIPRVRFGELLPEDDIVFVQEDQNGILWIGTRTLGCVAIRPAVFRQAALPKSDDVDSAMAFLSAMAKDSERFYGTKTEQIIAMTPLPNGSVMVASRGGGLETMEYPGSSAETPAVSETKTATIFPKVYSITEDKPKESNYPSCLFLADDVSTGRHWEGKYGNTYALIGGGKFPHDKMISFDETLCKVRPFVGNAGNRTRPLERVTLISAHHHHDHSEHGKKDEKSDKKQDEKTEEHHAHSHQEEESLMAWSSIGNAVPRTFDGQHLWCEVRFTKPGVYQVALFFVDPDVLLRNRPRDYLLEVFPEIPAPRVRVPRSDWQEPGRRADEWAAAQTPLAVSRVQDFGGGVYKRVLLTGPGTYNIRINKNYSRKIDLCFVLIDRQGDPLVPQMPEKTEKQEAVTIE